MAYTKNTSKDDLEAEIIDEDSDSSSRKSTKRTTMAKTEHAPNDLIDCISIMPGFVCMTGPKSNINYKWRMTGDIVGVEYQDLIMMANQRSNYLTKPFIAIQDEEIISHYPYLKEIYDNLYDVIEIKDIVLKLNVNDLRSTIEAMPVGVKESVKSVVATMIATGELDSISKIKAIDEIFGTKLSIATEFRN